MKSTKIDWCDATCNPIMGCPNGCKYCYARKLNDRFHFVDDWNKPQFFPERLKQLDSKKAKSIFMDSMSDCGWWTIPQIREIAKAMEKNPQHKYLFLSKRPDLFIEKCKTIVEDANKRNVFVGVSITKREDFVRLLYMPIYARRFVSIEPILADLGELNPYECDLFSLPYLPEVIIIGAETGNRKGKVIPEKAWVDNIVKAADSWNKRFDSDSILQRNGWYKVKIFMKESLRSIMGDDFRQDKLPWEIEK